MNLPLILASSSRYRRELLARFSLPFDCQSPAVDETPGQGESPRDLARRLARSKAEAVARSTQTASLVIGSDQVADLNGTALGKPGNHEKARAQLQQASGQSVQFHTAVAVIHSASMQCREALDLTRVQFRTLNAEAIDRYLDHEQPFDCAGSFKAEGLGITLFESIDSHDPTALIGLPLIAVAGMLRSFGVDLP